MLILLVMSINGGERHRKEARDFPPVPSPGSKRPGRSRVRNGVGRAQKEPPASVATSGDQADKRSNNPGTGAWRLERERIAGRGFFPIGTWRCLWLGFQSWLVFWVVLVMLSLVSWSLAAQLPSMRSTTWRDALAVGNGAFALSFGGAYGSDTMRFSLTPWGLTVFVGFLLVVSLRAAKPVNAVALLWGVLAFVLPASVCLLVAGLYLQVGWAFAVLACFALIVFLRVASRFTWWKFSCDTDANGAWSWILLSFRLVRAISRVALVVAALVLLVGIATGWDVMVRIWGSLHAGVFGSVVLVLAVLAYLPTMLVWASCWVVGPGFTMGTGTVFSPGQVTSGDLPPIPFLAWLPQVSLGWWTVVIPIVAGILGGVFMSRRHGLPLSDTLLSLAFTLLVLLGGGYVGLNAAGGALGPGRLSGVGPVDTALYAGVIAWGIPFVVSMILGHRLVVRALAGFSYKISGKSVDNLPTVPLDL